MKRPRIAIVTAFSLFALVACDKPGVEKRIAELEQKRIEAEQRQHDLERELEDQRIAVERDAIERERAQIEKDRAELERQQGEEAAAQDQALRDREAAIATRESTLERTQSDLGDRQDELEKNAAKLSERERELAGREALAVNVVEETAPVADYGTFYDSLSSYGSWFETADFGYVWQPAIVHDVSWRPYSRGRWICSDRGWTWLSDEPFGWATYHYGRWARLRDRGWIWVPGGEWAPCWVSWRQSDSHIGWAPLPPETLAYRGHAWDSSVDVQFGIAAGWFNFVEIRNFDRPIHGYCLPYSSNVTIISQTTNITFIHLENHQVICGGPRYDQLCDRIGRPLPFCRLDIDRHAPGRGFDSHSPFKDGRLRISAPNVDAEWNEGLRPAQVKGHLDGDRIARDKDVDREISDRFRRTRDEERNRAEEVIAKLGGRERFDEARVQQLQDNRRKVGGGRDDKGRVEIPDVKLAERGGNGGAGPASREVDPRRGDPAGDSNNDKSGKEVALENARKDEQEKPAVANRPDKDRGNDEATARAEALKAREEIIRRQREENLARQKEKEVEQQRRSDERALAETEMNPREANQDERPDANPQRPQKEIAENSRNEAIQKAQDETRQKQQDARQQAQDEGQRKLQDDAKRKQEEGRELARQQQEQARQQQSEMQRRQQEKGSANQQEQIQRQQDQARLQQQEETKRQQEQARLQQQEQARQQQQADIKRQQDEARQQQQEQIKRQQAEARQQQQEENQRRQAEARQQQQEQARQQQQEQARQQQQEQARQQQQEQARQQQQEQARQQQQEQARQQQQEQARQQQQEQARQQQQEQSRRQQEDDRKKQEDDRTKGR